MDSFSYILFLRQLHLDMNMCCFMNSTLNLKLHFSIKKSSVRLLSYMSTSKHLAELTARRQKWRQNGHTDVMHESRLTPLM